MADARKELYRRLSLRLHPDRGGDPEKFIRMQRAYDSTQTAEEFETELRKVGISDDTGNFTERAKFNTGWSPRSASFYFHKKEDKTSSQETRREDIPLLPPPQEKNLALEEKSESEKDTNKLTVYEKPKEKPINLGGTARDAKCPKCEKRNVRVTDEGVYICNECGFSSRNADDFFPKVKGNEGALSEVIHSSYLPVAVATFVGLMIPIIFGANIGTALVAVGIIFLGLSKI